MKNKIGFLYSFENMRAIVVLLVVLSHFTFFSKIGGVVECFHKALVSEISAVFVFISGFLFCYLSKKNGFFYGRYLNNKLKFIVVPYVLFVSLGVFVGLLFELNYRIGLGRVAYFLWSFIVGGAVIGALWFIPMICLFFIATPLFLKMSDSKFFGYFVFVFMVISIFTFRPIGQFNPILSFFHFIGFYLLGMYFTRTTIFMHGLLERWGVSLAVSFAFFVYCCYQSVGDPVYNGFFDKLFMINWAMLSKFFLTVFLFVLSSKLLSARIKCLSYIANISFGLYFVHMCWLLISLKIVNIFGVGLVEYAAIEFLFGIVFSIISIEVVKKVCGARSRYVIGC